MPYDDRIQLMPAPAASGTSDFQVALLGHCPGRHELAVLRDDPAACRRIERLGLGRLLAEVLAGEGARLDGLPIPVRSAAHFRLLFPEAAHTTTRYRSLLGGQRAWLPVAVEDYFRAAGASLATTLWVVPVREPLVSRSSVDAGQSAFMPELAAGLREPEELPALNRALLIPDLALLGLPDLERLQVPPNMPDHSRVRLPNPAPAFVPCSADLDDGHRERRHADEVPAQPAPWSTARCVAPMVRALAELRPDVQVLLTLPPAYRETNMATVCEEAVTWLEEQAQAPGRGLHRVQFLFPYLAQAGGGMASAVGAIAGTIAQRAAVAGPWRSVAGMDLSVRRQAFPTMEAHHVIALRDKPGIGVLVNRRGRVQLDDERLVSPAVHVPAAASAQPAYRCGEVARFMGWLRRGLEGLGERLVFDAAPEDPRPRMLLDRFFARLHEAGALRGHGARDAYRITQRYEAENVIAFDIEIAVALPIDWIRVHIGYDRAIGVPRLDVLDMEASLG